MGQIERFLDIRNEKTMIDTNLKKVKKKVNLRKKKTETWYKDKNTLIMCTISPKVILMYKKVYRTN